MSKVSSSTVQTMCGSPLLGMVNVVDEDKLSSVLSEFARTVITDFPIQGILDHLVGRIVGVLPITAAGVTLISSGKSPHYIAASDSSALQFERLQTEIGQGPCLEAFSTGEAVAVADLATDTRFPLFSPAAVRVGLAAVFTFPLRHGAERLGALDLYRDSPGGLDPHDMAVAQTLADVTAAYLLNAQAREEATVTSARFHHSATHDQLTGLPNRLLLQERLDHAAQRARRSHSTAAILFADLDRFKEVNDIHGHHGGDELLVAVARRLSGLVRSGDTLARFSGDEFVILFEDLHDAADAEKLATRINDAFITPFIVAGAEVAITASIGVAFAGSGQQISEELIVEADLAMYAAKRDGGAGHQTVDTRRAHLHDRPNSLERPIRSALAADELDLAYQPIVRSVDGVVTGVEALLRWTDRDRGAISPMTMVEVAEQSGLIDELGEWVLARACRDHQRWFRERPDLALDLAVNVSARQLSTPGFVSSVRDALRLSGTDPSSLILEMTESVFIDESERVADTLGELDAAGIRLAIDDFGTGYSSMSYLGRLPVRIVKIDQCFIAHLGDDSGGKIVLAITNLAHDLGLTVVAEGVETISESNTVRAMGCDSAQGFVYARPMPASAISAHLARFAGNNRKCSSTARQWRLPDETAPFVDDPSSNSELRARVFTWSPHCASSSPAHDSNALVGR